MYVVATCGSLRCEYHPRNHVIVVCAFINQAVLTSTRLLCHSFLFPDFIFLFLFFIFIWLDRCLSSPYSQCWFNREHFGGGFGLHNELS